MNKILILTLIVITFLFILFYSITKFINEESRLYKFFEGITIMFLFIWVISIFTTAFYVIYNLEIWR